MVRDMRNLLRAAVGVLLGTLALTSCSGVPVAPAYTQEELAARCARTGGWWKDSRSYSLVSGHCEYRD
jgi:hypothetical protein